MFTQLSLFDLPGQFDSVSSVVSLGSSGPQNAPEAAAPVAKTPELVRIYGESRGCDSIQPMGDLARLVIARYEMMARRREAMTCRKAENPRKSIRVLSPT